MYHSSGIYGWTTHPIIVTMRLGILGPLVFPTPLNPKPVLRLLQDGGPLFPDAVLGLLHNITDLNFIANARPPRQGYRGGRKGKWVRSVPTPPKHIEAGFVLPRPPPPPPPATPPTTLPQSLKPNAEARALRSPPPSLPDTARSQISESFQLYTSKQQATQCERLLSDMPPTPPPSPPPPPSLPLPPSPFPPPPPPTPTPHPKKKKTTLCLLRDGHAAFPPSRGRLERLRPPASADWVNIHD